MTAPEVLAYCYAAVPVGITVGFLLSTVMGWFK